MVGERGGVDREQRGLVGGLEAADRHAVRDGRERLVERQRAVEDEELADAGVRELGCDRQCRGQVAERPQLRGRRVGEHGGAQCGADPGSARIGMYAQLGRTDERIVLRVPDDPRVGGRQVVRDGVVVECQQRGLVERRDQVVRRGLGDQALYGSDRGRIEGCGLVDHEVCHTASLTGDESARLLGTGAVQHAVGTQGCAHGTG